MTAQTLSYKSSDVLVIFPAGINPNLLETMISEHLKTVKTNTDITRKEIWFVCNKLEDFLQAYQRQWDTPINKRVILIANAKPDFQKMIKLIKSDRRLVCLGPLRIRFTLWMLIASNQFKRKITDYLSHSLKALQKKTDS